MSTSHRYSGKCCDAVDRWPERTVVSTPDDPQFEPRVIGILERFYAEGCERWGKLPLSFEAFRGHFLGLARRRLARGARSAASRWSRPGAATVDAVGVGPRSRGIPGRPSHQN